VLIDSVADGAWCGGVVLGSICKGLNQIDSQSIAGELTVNGEMRARGVSSAVMGDPVLAVAWLANKLAEFGEGLEAGHTVMSGSFTTLISIRSESSITASFGTLGDVQVQIAQ
jgi:2-keto-4-pentenoate hydratase